jgi:carbohydrate-selective porin OprB
MLTDVFGCFGRFGWQRPDLGLVSVSPNAAPCEFSWSSGLQMTGKYWNRLDDVLAFGIGQVIPGEEYENAGNGGAAEGHFEAYYKCQLFKHLAISPDFQVIWNPMGFDSEYAFMDIQDEPIFVYGVRGQIDF